MVKINSLTVRLLCNEAACTYITKDHNVPSRQSVTTSEPALRHSAYRQVAAAVQEDRVEL